MINNNNFENKINNLESSDISFTVPDIIEYIFNDIGLKYPIPVKNYKQTLVVSAFPGTGKSYFKRHCDKN